jgi:hypothetical protein
MNSKGHKPYHVAISKIEFANKGNIRIAAGVLLAENQLL